MSRLLPDSIKYYIVFMSEEGYSNNEIKNKVWEKFKRNVHGTTIIKLLNKYKDSGSVENNYIPKRKTYSDTTERAICREFIKNPYLKPKELAKDKNANIANLGDRTIRNILKNYDILPKQKNNKKILTKIHMKNRLKFAYKSKKEHFNWESVVFSDETDLFPCDTETRFAYLRRSHSLPPINNKDNKNWKSKKVKVGGMICFEGTSCLIRYEDSMNAAKYLEILKENLLDFMPELENQKKNGNNSYVFMQDGAACHRTKIITEFLEENGVITLEGPSKSPDLNPIENVWALIKRKLGENKENINNAEDTWNNVCEIWENFDIEIIDKLYISIPFRIEEVIKKKGARISK